MRRTYRTIRTIRTTRAMHPLFACLLIAAAMLCGPTAFAAAQAKMSQNTGAYVSGGFYEGTFSDGTAFQMNLMLAPQLPHGTPAPPASTQLRSAYWKPQLPRETTVWLQASRQADEIVAAVPPAKPGTTPPPVSETFVGKTADDGATITGIWTRSTGEQLDFTMKRRFAYVTQYTSYVTLDSVGAFGSRATETVAIYPQTNLASLDDTMPSLSGGGDGSHPLGSDDTDTQAIVTVAWASSHQLFLVREDYQYPFGAPHETTSVTFALYDIRGNQVKELGLTSFLPSSTCVQAVSDRVVAGLVAQHASMPEAGALSTDHAQVIGHNYLVLPDGIDFYFGQNSMGNPVETHDVFVTKQDLGRCGYALPRYPGSTGPSIPRPPTEVPAGVPGSKPPTDLPAGIE